MMLRIETGSGTAKARCLEPWTHSPALCQCFPSNSGFDIVLKATTGNTLGLPVALHSVITPSKAWRIR